MPSLLISLKKNHILTIFILSFCGLAVVSQLYIPIPIIPVFANYFSLPISSAIWVGSAFGFFYAIGFLFWGPLSDRFGYKTIMLAGLFLLALISIGIGFVKSFELLIVLRALQGFVAASFAPSALGYIGEHLLPHHRATAVACMSTGFLAAGVVGQLFASQINFIFAWHAIFLLSGIIYLVLLFLIQFLIHETAKVHEHNIKLKSFYLAMLKHLKNGNLISTYTCSFFILFTFVAMYTAIAPYLSQQFHFSHKELFTVRTWGLLGVSLTPFSGILVKKWGSKNVITAGLIIAALSLFCEGMFTAKEFIIFSTIPFVAGISTATTGLISYTSESATRAKASALALYTFFVFLGAASGSLFATHLELFGFKTIMLLISGMLIAVVAFFALFQKLKTV
jgi:YNFM family putative membrane transporter